MKQKMIKKMLIFKKMKLKSYKNKLMILLYKGKHYKMYNLYSLQNIK